MNASAKPDQGHDRVGASAEDAAGSPHGDHGVAAARDLDAGTRAPRVLKTIERGMLILVGGLTVIAAGLELWAIGVNRAVTLADILLMFLYTEVIGMVSVFYISRTLVVIYPIFIAITALARLIVLQGKDMDPINIVFEAAAIFILALAVLLLGRRRDG